MVWIYEVGNRSKSDRAQFLEGSKKDPVAWPVGYGSKKQTRYQSHQSVIWWFQDQIRIQHLKLPQRDPSCPITTNDASINQSHQSITVINNIPVQVVISRSDSNSAWKNTPERCLMSHNTKWCINQSIASITRIIAYTPCKTTTTCTCISIKGHWPLHFAENSQNQGTWVSYKRPLEKSTKASHCMHSFSSWETGV